MVRLKTGPESGDSKTDSKQVGTDGTTVRAVRAVTEGEEEGMFPGGPDDPNDPERAAASGDETDDDIKTTLPFSKARCFGIVATTAGAGFLNIVSLQSGVIILPTISTDLDIPASRQQWVLSSYTLAFGCFLLVWGRIADLYGKRTVFILGSAFVVVVTAINPVLSNEIAFDFFRGLQGFGAAANVPTAIGILGVTFPPGKAKNYAFSAYAAGAPLGAIFGNVLSGLVATYASWKWVFWVLAMLSTAVTLAGIFVIPALPDTRTAEELASLSLLHSVDWIGATLITAGLVALLFALTEGNVVGWSTPWVPMLIVIAALLIAIFAAWQLYQEYHTTRAPLMRLSMFHNKHFVAAVGIMGLFFGLYNDFTVYITYLWQDYQGLSPMQTMVRFLPGAGCGLFVAFAVAHLISRVPTYRLLLVGQLAMCFTLILVSIPIPDTTSYFAYGFPAMVLGVLGADTAWPCLTLYTSKSLPEKDQAMGGAIINASGQIGRAIGLAITTAVQTAVTARERGVSVREVGSIKEWDTPSLKGIRAANWFNFGLCICCLVICFASFRGTGIVGKIPDPPQRRGGLQTR